MPIIWPPDPEDVDPRPYEEAWVGVPIRASDLLDAMRRAEPERAETPEEREDA